ncbi:MAG: hypothetical protein QNJ51_24530 [Calothrix sp. MO_167.B12]|nr:hypothetical protein [Calothrix sp. MO_167.B12]
MLTFEQVLDNVMQLPLEQREMLIEILQKRHIEQRREEIAQNARDAILEFRTGKLKPQSASDIISTFCSAS